MHQYQTAVLSIFLTATFICGYSSRNQGNTTGPTNVSETIADHDAAEPAAKTIEKLLALPEDRIDIGHAALELAQAYEETVDVQDGLAEIDQMARELHSLLNPKSDPQKKLTVMAQYLFETKQFGLPRSVAEENEHRLLHQLLQTRRGVCFPLTVLYIALGERLKLPLFFIDAPEHSFVRFKDGDHLLNIETTHKGLIYTPAAYARRFDRVTQGFYLRPLSRREVLGIILMQQGVRLVDLKRVEEAMYCYEAALRLIPESATAWYNKGLQLQQHFHQYGQALVCFDKATKFDPQDVKSWGNKGTALAQLGRYQEALVCCEQALAINSELPEKWMDKGFVLAKLSRPREALTCYDKALKLRPKFSQAWFMKGLAQNALGQKPEALSCFDQAIAIDPRREFPWHFKAVTLLELGQAQEALVCSEKAVSLNAKFAPAWETKASIHQKLSQYDEAWRCVKTAEKLSLKVSPQFKNELGQKMPEPSGQ